ncbi:MAG: c-type cytochrome [Thermodesulfobacteriota bacterium]
MKNLFFLMIFVFFLLIINIASCNNIKKDDNSNQDKLAADKSVVSSSKSGIIENKPIDSVENNEKAAIDQEDAIQHLNELQPDAKLGEIAFNNTCASCHGISGIGDGVAAAGLNPKPRDLSDSEYLSKLSDDHLYKVISEGGGAVGLSPLMPPWHGILTEQDINNVISHIRTDICRCKSSQQIDTQN